ncbi:MAG: sigma-70 family RNA polymerase sigma factor [Gemmataceae bacterium]
MPDDFRDRILRTLRRLFPAEVAAGSTDADLLSRFVHGRDESAFELLVWRHAALVLHVCRQVLRDEQAAEDAFQATFLVLVKKAGSVLRGEALPGWLHRVAFRAALRARPRQAVRTGVDLDGMPAAAAPADDGEREALHEEIARLPAKYRQPIVCCYLEGKTHDEAAAELGWPKGTVAGRLSRARDLLRTRLARRGLALGAGPELAAGAATARRVAALLAGLRNAPSMPPAVVALAEGVIHVMFWTKMRWVGIVIVAIGAAGAAGGTWGSWREHGLESQAVDSGRGRAGEVGSPDVKGERAGQPNLAERRPTDPAEDPLQGAADRALVRRNLKALALAMHNYHDANGQFPPAAVTDRAGKPLLSWRVLLLPYLGQEALYKEFRLNEPWDSPTNKKLLARMPPVFTPVGEKAQVANSTFYQVFVGPGAVYGSHHNLTGWPGTPGLAPGAAGPGGGGGGAGMSPPGVGEAAPGGPPSGVSRGSPAGPPGRPTGMGMAGMGGPPGLGSGMGMMPGGGPPGMMGPTRPSFASISDGTSNTFLIAEAGTPVPWAKPDDIPFDPRKPVPKLGGQFPHTFHVAFADGSVRAFPKSLDPATLRAAITANGGEVVVWDKAGKPPVSPARQQMLDRLRDRKHKLQEEAEILAEILGEMRVELDNLRWEVEREKLLALDADAAALQRENEKLEKSLREGREQARKMMQELRKLKEEMRKREEK